MKVGEEFRPYKKFIGSMIPNSLMRYKEVSDGAKLCYGRLCQYNGKKGDAFPSYESLGRELGVTRRTAINRVNELEEKGFVKVYSNNGSTNCYKFLWHEIFEEEINGKDNLTSEDTFTSGVKQISPGGEATFTRGVKDSSLGGEATFTRGVKDPSPKENHIRESSNENNIKETDKESNVRDTENTESDVSVSVDGKDIHSIFDNFCSKGIPSRTKSLIDKFLCSKYSEYGGLTSRDEDIILSYSEKLSEIHYSNLEKKVNQKLEEYNFPIVRSNFDIRNFMEFLVS